MGYDAETDYPAGIIGETLDHLKLHSIDRVDVVVRDEKIFYSSDNLFRLPIEVSSVFNAIEQLQFLSGKGIKVNFLPDIIAVRERFISQSPFTAKGTYREQFLAAELDKIQLLAPDKIAEITEGIRTLEERLH